MRITITNDEGEVYVIAMVTRLDPRIVVTDDESDEVTLDTLVRDAAIWEKNED